MTTKTKRPNHVRRSLGKCYTKRLRKSYYKEYQQPRGWGRFSAADLEAGDNKRADR